MKRIARLVVALIVPAFALPALACGFEKQQTTTMSVPAPAPTVARADKAKQVKKVKGARVKAPPAGATVATTY
jgi:hypothetical protein